MLIVKDIAGETALRTKRNGKEIQRKLDDDSNQLLAASVIMQLIEFSIILLPVIEVSFETLS